MTNPTVSAAGYIVHNNEAIWGCGTTADAAWGDFLRGMAEAGVRVVDAPTEEDIDSPGNWTRESDYTIKSASAGLLQAVNDLGGNMGWTHVGGVACTTEEEEAAHEAAGEVA